MTKARDITKMKDVVKRIQIIIDADFDGKQKALADAISISESYMSRMLTGDIDMRFSVIRSICLKLGYSGDWLATGKGNRKHKDEKKDVKLITEIHALKTETKMMHIRQDQQEARMKALEKEMDELKAILHAKAG